MIATISGTITLIYEQSIVIEQSGVGFELYIPSLKNIYDKEYKSFFVYLHWNQESGPTLYGFESHLDKIVFLLIISCSGIGPKIGLTILGQMDATLFLQNILEENSKNLSTINGIGIKKAEQMIVALKHKVTKLLKDHPELTENAQSLGIWKDLIETLSSLNYSSQEIKLAMNHLKEHNFDNNSPLSHLLRKALAFLAKK